jgi:ribosomal protein S27E
LRVVAVQDCKLKVDGKCPKRRGRFPSTKIRLFWALQGEEVQTIAEAAVRLAIKPANAYAAHSTFGRCPCPEEMRNWCPDCLTRTVIYSEVVRACSKCGRELPYIKPVEREPNSHSEYAIPSIINHNLGSDPNGTIVELRKAPGRGDESYLSVLGYTHWSRLGGEGEDDELTKKALIALSGRLKEIQLPQPVYLWSARLGVAVRKQVSLFEKQQVKPAEKRVRELTSGAAISSIVNAVIERELRGRPKQDF